MTQIPNLEAAGLIGLTDLLRVRSQEDPKRLAYVFLSDGEHESDRMTYGELDARARALGARLQELGMEGERALLLYPPGLHFIAAFFGCLYSGTVAVPAYPPRRKGLDSRLAAIVADAGPRVALTTASIHDRIASWETPELEGVTWIVSDGPELASARDFRVTRPGAEDLAFLQYTSGSTSAPKGVMVSHGNLLHNEKLIHHAFGQTEHSIVIGWLPMFHDMGLIGTLIQPLFSGGYAVLMSPLAFLQKPARWLQAISHYRADTSGGPNFAYDLCVRKISPDERDALDLSCWRVAFNGAEPIRGDSLARFAEAFAGCGFRRRAFVPCYGLAEATLLVAGRRRPEPAPELRVSASRLERARVFESTARDGRTQVLVSSGPPESELDVRIVDPESGAIRARNEVGEIWIAGQSVAQGYWGKPEETERTFLARLDEGGGPFLRTGDLGFLHQGELYVTGRLKDLVIIRGRNHYPQDLEQTAERSHRALRPGCGAAFSVDAGGEEKLVIVHEVDRHFSATPEEIADGLRRAVAEGHQVRLHELVLIRAGTLPKTSSGKIRRSECRRRYLDGELVVIASSTLEARSDADEEAAELTGEALLSLPDAERSAALGSYLAGRIGRVLDVASAEVDPGRPLTALGLDSLEMLELRHAVEEAFGVGLSAAKLLSGATLEDLREELLARLASSQEGPAPTLERRAGGDVSEAPLSYGQRALWFLHRLAPESAAYHLAAAVKLEESADLAALRRSFELLARRHPVLRTTFGARHGEPFQRILETVELPLREIDAAGWDDGRLRERLGEAARRPFAPELEPVWRLGLFVRSAREKVLLLVMHHIIGDFWSLAILLRELGELYEAEKARPGAGAGALEPLAYRYTDFVRWEQESLASPVGESLWDFWREELAGELPILELPTDRPRPAVQSYQGGVRSAALDPGTSQRLKAVSRERGATLYTTLLSAYLTWLHRYAGQDELIVGSPSNGRSLAGLAGVVGYFVNPLAIRARLGGNPTFPEFVNRVARSVVGAIDHQAFPFALLAERLQPERDASRSPLFQTLFTLQTPPPGAPPELAALAIAADGAGPGLGGLASGSVGFEIRASRFDLSLTLAEVSGELRAVCEYSAHLFEASTIDRMLDSLAALLGGVAEAPTKRLTELPLLGAGERRQLIHGWNDTAAALPRPCRVHELIAVEARRRGESVAVAFDGRQLSYAELDRRSTALARRLRGLGVAPEALVGVCLEPSLAVPVALLGVWKAGGAYVPLDPTYPSERLAWMLEDSRAEVLVTQDELARELPDHEARVVAVDRQGGVSVDHGAAMGVSSGTGPENLAYVIYTSGSTGRPKGVQIPHRALANFLASMAREPGLAEGDVVMSVTTLSFDIAALELFLPLVTGARVELVPRRVATDGTRLARALADSAATVAQATPATWKLLLDAGWRGAELRALCGGEAMATDLAARLLERTASLWNLYGPTETTVWSAIQKVERAALEDRAIAIGRPVANTGIHLVDRTGRLLPAGAAGELLIGGAGLSRGYLRRPRLTAEKFVPDAFGDVGGERLYRTGDLARYRPDGAIEYLGRLDTQVKVRGFRIELREIEEALRRHPGVREAVAAVSGSESGEGLLVAYVVARGESPTTGDLRGFLMSKLPGAMVPSAYVWLDALPLTPNGKIDRKRLSPPAPERSGGAVAFLAAENPVQEVLANTWAELLGAETVGLEDDFFELGGHSLKAAQVVSRVREAFGVELDLRSFFRYPTVAGLAERIRALRSEGSEAGLPPLRRAPRSEALPLAFGQERLWFFAQLHGDGAVYNMPLAVHLRGRLDTAALAGALAEIVRRHEVLRTAISDFGGRPAQSIATDVALEVQRVDLGGLGLAGAEAEATRLVRREAVRPFDLSRAPLLRASLLRLGSHRHSLVLVTHHIAADAWSLEAFWHELEELYEAYSAGRPSPLPDLDFQYADYAAWQRAHLDEERLASSLAFWRRRLAGLPAVHLPTDRARPAVRSFRGGFDELTLPAAAGGELAAFCRRHGATAFMALLAGFQMLLARYTGQDDTVVGSPMAQRHHRETEGLIGFFVNVLVLRADLSGGVGFRRFLERIRRGVLEAHDHRQVPVELLEKHLSVPSGSDPLFQVTFAHEYPAPRPRLPGLEVSSGRAWSGFAKFDLSFTTARSEAGLTCSAEYNVDLFDSVTIQRLLRQFSTLLRAAVADPERPVGELPLVESAARQQILTQWNDSRSAASRVPVHERFAEGASSMPHAVAAVSGESVVTRGELDRRANRLARHLRRLGVRPEARVGLLVNRSIELVVGALGILKAGGAYVPMDPAYPAERLAYMLEDAGVTVLVTEEKLLVELSPDVDKAVCLDRDRETLAGESADEVPGEVLPEQLAYVIYTSGSTGTPKGVAIAHAGLANLVTWHHGAYAVTSRDRATLLAGLGFDASVWELWSSLAAGAVLELVPAELIAAPRGLVEWLAARKIDWSFLPTPLAEAVLAEKRPIVGAFRALLTGGDRLHKHAAGLPYALVNHYGPTENTVVSTWTRVESGEPASGPPPIGRPIANTRAFVLDRNLGPAVPLVAGELSIAGVGLARGYLGRAALTAERFIPDPFGEPGNRLYRSGDLTRHLPSGDLEFLGRIDHQVKIRGFRIELGEIESALGRHPAVQDAVVELRESARPGNEKRLIAYVASPGGSSDLSGDLKVFLSERLPEFMVPSAFVVLDGLPLTANGKVDRRALPTPDAFGAEARRDLVAPRSGVEKRLAQIWSELLTLDQVGVHDNFFELGGHSLQAAQMVSRIRDLFGVEIPLQSAFEAPTIEGLSRALAQSLLERQARRLDASEAAAGMR